MHTHMLYKAYCKLVPTPIATLHMYKYICIVHTYMYGELVTGGGLQQYHLAVLPMVLPLPITDAAPTQFCQIRRIILLLNFETA